MPTNVSKGLTIKLVAPWPKVGINKGYFINIIISIIINNVINNNVKHIKTKLRTIIYLVIQSFL